MWTGNLSDKTLIGSIKIIRKPPLIDGIIGYLLSPGVWLKTMNLFEKLLKCRKNISYSLSV